MEMGVGAVLSYQLIPCSSATASTLPCRPPVRSGAPATGVDRAAAYRSLATIAQETTNPDNFGVAVIGVQRPAEILNYRSLGDTPAFLGAGLATGAIAALALTLVASVRRRRRDLAVLKTLGFTERQLAATVAWHSSTAVAIGVVAVPLGIALGRTLWDLFAHDINAVPAPSVPWERSCSSPWAPSCWPMSSPPSPGGWRPHTTAWCCAPNKGLWHPI